RTMFDYFTERARRVTGGHHLLYNRETTDVPSKLRGNSFLRVANFGIMTGQIPLKWLLERGAGGGCEAPEELTAVWQGDRGRIGHVVRLLRRARSCSYQESFHSLETNDNATL